MGFEATAELEHHVPLAPPEHAPFVGAVFDLQTNSFTVLPVSGSEVVCVVHVTLAPGSLGELLLTDVNVGG